MSDNPYQAPAAGMPQSKQKARPVVQPKLMDALKRVWPQLLKVLLPAVAVGLLMGSFRLLAAWLFPKTGEQAALWSMELTALGLEVFGHTFLRGALLAWALPLLSQSKESYVDVLKRVLKVRIWTVAAVAAGSIIVVPAMLLAPALAMTTPVTALSSERGRWWREMGAAWIPLLLFGLPFVCFYLVRSVVLVYASPGFVLGGCAVESVLHTLLMMVLGAWFLERHTLLKEFHNPQESHV